MTVNETIQNHLRKHGYITAGIALLEYGMTNGLAQEINRLRNRGWNIRTDSRKSEGVGRKVTKYVLEDVAVGV